MLPLFDLFAPIITKVLDYIPDPAQKAEAQLKIQAELEAHQEAILKVMQASDAGQTEVNKVAAASTDFFSRDWRSAVGWACAAAFGWAYVGQPVFTFILAYALPNRHVVLPTMDFSGMSTVLMGMLGLAGLHVYKETQQ